MMRAKLFVDDQKTITVEETDETVRIQIESAVQALKVTGLLLAARRYGEATPRGLLIGWFFTLVFGVRIVWEVFKRQQAHFEASLPLSMGQLLSIPVVLLGLGLLWWASRSTGATAARS
jgi:prolipoprotein diacylglyceryltransferase